MIQFSIEKWEDVVQELTVLWPKHYNEAIRDTDYNPDFDQYRKLFDADVLVIVAARRNQHLVGYAISLVQPHLHSKHVRWGVYDNYYLIPEARGPGVFGKMMQYSEDFLRSLGVTRLYATEPRHWSHASTWFAQDGWRFAERVYIKELS